MRYLTSFVQAPTSPPSSSSGAGSVSFGHRRRNDAGGKSATAILNGSSLPATLTFQGYQGQYAGDELLVKDGAQPWRVIPSQFVTGNTVDLSSISTVPTTWQALQPEELADTQAQFTISGLDFGEFSAASQPTQNIWLLNDGAVTIESLGVTAREPNGALSTLLSGRLRVSVMAILGPIGVGSAAFSVADSTIFAIDAQNQLRALAGVGSAIRLQLELINWPSTGLESSSIESEIVFTPNQSAYPVPSFLNWVEGSFDVSGGVPVLTTGTGDRVAEFSPYLLKIGGAVLNSSAPTRLGVPVGTEFVLWVSQSGTLSILTLGATPVEGSVQVGEFSWSSGVNNWRFLGPVFNPYVVGVPQDDLTPGRFVSIDDNGLFVDGDEASLGVALTSDSLASLGYVRIEVSQNVTAGQRLGPNATGLGVISAEGTATALEDGIAGDLVLCYLSASINVTGGSGGGSGDATNLGVLTAASTLTVTSSTGSNATLPAATTSLAGVLTASDKTKLDGIATGATQNQTDTFLLSRANHTGTQSTATIIGFTEDVQDILAATLTEGSNIALNYDDVAGTLTISSSGGGGGGGDPTNLGTSYAASSVTVTSSTGSNATIDAATTSLAGVLTSADKTKLNGIATGATQNQTDTFLLSRGNHTGTQSTATISGFTEEVQDTLAATLTAGANITLNYDDAAGTLTISSSGGSGGGDPTNLGATYAANNVTVTSSTGSDVTLNAATTSLAGVLTSADKTKLNGIGAGATLSNLGVTTSASNVVVTNTGGTSATIPAVTTSSAGLMIPADKTKLNGIVAGATITNLSLENGPTGNPYIDIINSGGVNVRIPAVSTSVQGVMGPNDKIKLDGIATGATLSNLGSTPAANTVTISNSGGTNAVIAAATQALAGVMTASDKTKLDGFLATVNGTTHRSYKIGPVLVCWGPVTMTSGNNVDYSGSASFQTAFSAVPIAVASFGESGTDGRLITLGNTVSTTSTILVQGRNNSAFATSGSPIVNYIAFGLA